MKCAVIFDVDGVLLDTVPLHFNAWKKMFEEQGARFTFDDYLEKVNGIPRIDGIKAVLKDKSEEELRSLATAKQNYFLESISDNPPSPLPGVINLLSFLKSLDIPLAAASSSKNAPILLEKAGLTEFLDAVVGGNDFKKPKPDPELFIIASEKIGIEPNNCIVVEDANVGVLAAKAAGMKTIGVLFGKDNLLINSADITVHNLEEKDKIIDFINKSFNIIIRT